MSVIILPGHTIIKGRDQGAVANGYTEGQITHRFVELLAEHLPFATLIQNRIAIEEVRALMDLQLPTNTLLLSIHCNAATPQATGAEVIYGPQAPLAPATQLSAILADTLNIRNRGAKDQTQTAHRRIGVLNTKYTRCYLAELFFLTNPADLNAYLRNESLLVERVANWVKLNI
jgi:N-acetylmuramoyl-L-alanine amidase